MIVYPAIDVLEGRVVRLREGDPSLVTVYSTDPAGTASEWARQGASWIHLVSLDAAFGRASVPLDLIRAAASAGPRVQYGGGVRDGRTARLAIEAGASRVVLGTAAAADPGLALELAADLGPGRVAAALDSRRGTVAVCGWRTLTGETPVALGRRLAEGGLRHVLYTEIERDGGMCGPAADSAASLASSTGLEVIASGGVSSIEDIALLARTGRIAGVILGRAIYEGAVRLADALRVAGRERAGG